MSQVSNLELLTRKFLAFYFPKSNPTYNYRPDFLKNPKTGKNFELDIYYHEFSFAVEVNGIQHLLQNSIERDIEKVEKCVDQDIFLFHVWDRQDIFQLPHHLKYLYSEMKDWIIDDEYFRRRLDLWPPRSLQKEIDSYVPSMSYQSEFFNAVKYELAREKNGFTIEKKSTLTQEEETARIRRKMADKERMKSP